LVSVTAKESLLGEVTILVASRHVGRGKKEREPRSGTIGKRIKKSKIIIKLVYPQMCRIPKQ